jgi:hypothetical protein
MKEEEKVILYSSEEAAKIMTVTGWVSSTGRFWGKDEHMARWEGSTHKTCDCGVITEKGYSKCEKCRLAASIGAYKKMPFKEWNYETPLINYQDDKFFWNEEDIIEYLEENDLKPEDLNLVICEPNYFYKIDSDYWEDILPEDGDIPKELEELLKKVNEYCETAKPISWTEGKYRTEYKLKTEV